MTSHPTAADLYEAVRRRLPRISLATVYRNLDLLATEGLIQRLPTGGARGRFDGDPESHHHVRCVSCGKVDDLCGVPLELGQEPVSSVNDFEVLGHELHFVGLCPECRR